MIKLAFVFITLFLTVESLAAQTNRVRSLKSEVRVCAWTDIETEAFTTNKISGIVTDSNAAFIPKVTLELRSQMGSRIAGVKSDKKGNFVFPLISPGRYLLKARWSKPGFNCREIEIEVAGSVDRPRTLVLEVSPIEVVIEH